MEEAAKGVIAGLAAAGYSDGDTIRLRRFNAEGDAATSNTIARELVGGEYDLIITLSTASLQAVASANRDAKVRHVFGMVSDPVAAGVGIARDDAKKHPPYMVGLGTMQPVAEAFRMAEQLAPRLARVGVAWNPSEANSEACTRLARTVCSELGIELLEANVDNSAGVREAVASVIDPGSIGDLNWRRTPPCSPRSFPRSVRLDQARYPGFFRTQLQPGAFLRRPRADFYQVGGKVGELAGQVLSMAIAWHYSTHPLRSSQRTASSARSRPIRQAKGGCPQGESKPSELPCWSKKKDPSVPRGSIELP